MPYYLATATLAPASGFPEDAIVNSFCLYRETAPSSTATWNNWANILHSFYNDGGSVTTDVKQFLSPEFDRATGITYRFYDITDHLDGSPHGSPLHVETKTVSGTADATGLPAEVAVVLTLRGANWASELVETPDSGDLGLEPDRPRARVSGRIYIGPLSVGACDMIGGRARVDPNLTASILNRAEAMFNSFVTSTVGWHVWSRKSESARLITHLQVDNAFDIQRRRGRDASIRTTTILND